MVVTSRQPWNEIESLSEDITTPERHSRTISQHRQGSGMKTKKVDHKRKAERALEAIRLLCRYDYLADGATAEDVLDEIDKIAQKALEPELES